MLDHTQLKLHNTLASMDVLLHATKKQNNSTQPDVGTLVFQRTMRIPRHG